MSVIEPWGLDAGADGKPEYTGGDFRALLSGLLMPGNAPLSARSGVLSGMESSISGLNVTIQPGTCVVNTSQRGPYISGLKEAVTLPVDPPHATYGRRDIVVCQVHDTAADGRKAEVRIVAGTPSANPVTPSRPSGAATVASVTVPASGAASTAAVIGVAAVRGALRGTKYSNSADQLARGASEKYPVPVWRADKKQLMIHDGSAFHQVAPQRTNIQHTFKSGFSTVEAAPLQIYRLGDRYFMEGCAKRSEGSSKINDHIVGSLPNIADRPAFNTRCAGIGQYTYRLMLFVTASGDFGFVHNESSTLSANNWVSFTGMTWSAK